MKLKEKRIEKKLSQEKLARMVNITLKHYQNIEKGKSLPTVIIAINIAKILNSTVEELFSEQDHTNIDPSHHHKDM